MKNKLVKIFCVQSNIIKQLISSVPSYLIALSFGMSCNITGVMLPQLREDKTILYEASHESWIGSINCLSMIIGSVISGQIMDSYGRKFAYGIMGVPYIIGWLVIIYAPSTSIIIVGRFVTGISSGTVRNIISVYIGEISSPKIRGVTLHIPGVMYCSGIILGHTLTHTYSWKICGWICVIVSVLVVISSIFIKESPLWLISRKRTDEGKAIFRWLRGTDADAENELEDIINKQAETSTKRRDMYKILYSRVFIKPLLTLFVVMVNVQCSGVNSIIFYAHDIFAQMFSGNINPFLIILAMDGIFAFVAVTICVLSKFLSKKTIFCTANIGVCVFAAALITCLVSSYENFIWAPVLCLVMFLYFSSNILATGWAFIPELLPNSVRGIGSGITSAFSYILLFAVAKLTPYFMLTFGAPGVVTLYGVISFICGLILYFLIPNTENKTLQSIEDGYKK